LIIRLSTQINPKEDKTRISFSLLTENKNAYNIFSYIIYILSRDNVTI